MTNDSSPDKKRKPPDPFFGTDNEMLEWYFWDGLCYEASSTFGPALERASLYSDGSKDCKKCKGKAWIDKIVYLCTHCRTTNGRTADGLAPCRYCNGKRFIEVKEQEAVGAKAYPIQDACDACRGTGLVPRSGHRRRKGPITAEPGTSPRNSPDDPYSLELFWHGSMSRCLPKLSDHDIQVLYLYWGAGSAYANLNRFGRIWPVLTLTELGKELLRRYANNKPKKIKDAPFLDIDPEYSFEKKWDDFTQPEILEQLTLLPSRIIKQSQWDRARSEAQTIVHKTSKAWRITYERVKGF